VQWVKLGGKSRPLVLLDETAVRWAMTSPQERGWGGLRQR